MLIPHQEAEKIDCPFLHLQFVHHQWACLEMFFEENLLLFHLIIFLLNQNQCPKELEEVLVVSIRIVLTKLTHQKKVWHICHMSSKYMPCCFISFSYIFICWWLEHYSFLIISWTVTECEDENVVTSQQASQSVTMDGCGLLSGLAFSQISNSDVMEVPDRIDH